MVANSDMIYSSNIQNGHGSRDPERRRCRRIPRSSLLCRLPVVILSITLAVSVRAAATDPPLDNVRATISDGGTFSETGNQFRQDFCLRYSRESSEEDISSALNGTQLNVYAKSGKYFLYDKATGFNPEYPGIHARMMDHIAQKGGFTWRDSFGEWGEEEKGNSSFTELLQWGTDKYDLLLGTYTPSTERMKGGVSFVKGHFDGSLILIRDVDPPEIKIDWINWTKPFDIWVWATILAVIVASAFSYQLVESLGAKGRVEKDKSVRVWVMENLYLSFVNFTGNYSYEPETLGGRVFGIAFAFWAMLITAAYTANLASLLVGKAKVDLRVHDIQDVINRRLYVCVHETSFSDNYLRTEHPEIAPYLVPVAKSDMYSSLVEGMCDVLVAYKRDFETAQKQKASNPDCTLKWEGKTVKNLADSFTTKHDAGLYCTDLVNEVFSYYITEMEDDGTLETLWREHDEYYSDEGHCGASTTKGRRRLGGTAKKGAASGGAVVGGGTQNVSRSPSLSLVELAGTMLFQVVGFIIALAVAFVSGFEPKTKSKRHVRRELTKRNLSVGCDSDDDEKRAGSVQKELRQLNERIDVMTGMLQLAVQQDKPTEEMQQLMRDRATVDTCNNSNNSSEEK